MQPTKKAIIIHLANKVTKKSADEPYISYVELVNAMKSMESEQGRYDYDRGLMDVSSLHYLNSTSVGLLIKMVDNLSDKAERIVLYAPTRPLQTLLEMLDLTGFFEIVPDTAGYLEKLREEGVPEIFVTISYDPMYA